jgi:hypothetical protein
MGLKKSRPFHITVKDSYDAPKMTGGKGGGKYPSEGSISRGPEKVPSAILSKYNRKKKKPKKQKVPQGA